MLLTVAVPIAWLAAPIAKPWAFGDLTLIYVSHRGPIKAPKIPASITAKAVMAALQNISKVTTIIIIAHRLNTIRDCDEIFFLEKGEVKGQGSYDELIKSNDLFKKFTHIN